MRYSLFVNEVSSSLLPSKKKGRFLHSAKSQEKCVGLGSFVSLITESRRIFFCRQARSRTAVPLRAEDQELKKKRKSKGAGKPQRYVFFFCPCTPVFVFSCPQVYCVSARSEDTQGEERSVRSTAVRTKSATYKPSEKRSHLLSEENQNDGRT